MARDAPAEGGPPREAEPLYALPPARFVAERNALAKTLAARDPEAAAAVRRLARPIGLAWVLNRLARDRPGEVKALLAAGDRLRTGQRQAIAGRGAEAFREADEALRAAARALRTAAGPILADGGRGVPGTRLAQVELLLRAAAVGDAATREALRRGVLAREPEVAAGGFGPLAAVPPLPAPGRARATAAPSRGRGREPAAAGPDPKVARAAAEAARRAAREREAAEARDRRERERAVAAAERALRDAERSHAAAVREVARRRADSDAAALRAREAEARAAAAAREVESRRAALARAAGG